MAWTSDQDLIREYARNGAEASFGELVHRHVDLVYSTAFRVLRNAGLAEEVSQRVFVSLARNAEKLEHRTVIGGWLHQTSRNYALETVRSEERRRQRERDASDIRNLDSVDPQTAWDQIATHLDAALAQLDPDDRDTILLRYFERKTAKEIGERLGLTAEAAQKRAARALERLRMIFSERGVAAPATGLAALLSLQAIQSAPAGLAASVIATGAVETITSTTSTIGLIMTSTKIKIGLAAALVAATSIPLAIQYHASNRLRGEIEGFRQQGAEVARLRDALQRLTAEAQTLAAERERERRELAGLRGELARAKAHDTRTADAAKSASTESPQVRTDAAAAEEGVLGVLVRRDEWKDVGFKAPSATVRTLEWAKVNGHTNVIANALAWPDENSRAGIEAIFAAAPESVRERYGSADQYVLSLFNNSGPADDRHTLLSYRIVDERVIGDEAILQMEYHYADGSSPTFPRRYVRIGNEWRQALDFDAPSQDKLSAGLQGEAAEAK